jgi:antirestriction protein
MATLEQVLEQNVNRGICISEFALTAFYENDPLYWATEDADDVVRYAEDSYSGEFFSDVDFAREMADNCGFIQSDEWPYSCIDWEQAARELMFDYYENDGCYFRSL